ncbi:MAG: beta-galactosidase trimerization domain-containing protein [Planctomycetota bacterium]|nr:beta-galactosidase trimerization domain-containing protein [Planctomycetota bacterium]
MLAAVCAHAPSASQAGESAVEQARADERARQEGLKKAPGYKKLDLTPARLHVVPLELPAAFERSAEAFPKSAHDVVIGADGNFLRDGKPVFLFGVEAELYNGAWLHRILGLDFTELSILARGEFRASLKVEKKKAADGTLLLEASSPVESPWLELRFKEALRGGTLLTYELMMNKTFHPLPYEVYDFQPPLYCPGVPGFHKNSSHFFDLCQENPEARQLYVNMLRWSARHARKYPVWMYELINEVSYICPCAANAQRFQEEMARKYGTLEQANSAWGTRYGSFEAVLPPLNIGSGMIYNSEWGVVPHGKDLSVPLWIDWARWMEGRGEEVFRELQAELQKLDPGAKGCYQSPYWEGRNAMSPATKGRTEDLYGGEQVLNLFRQERGSEKWEELTQMLEQQIANDLIRASAPAKPHVNLECTINGYPRAKDEPEKAYRIGAAGTRTFFWHQAVHGVSGSVIGYFYGNATSGGGGSVWDPQRHTLDSIRELPRTRGEIGALAEIVLPNPRIKGRIGVLYSLETSRVIRPEKDNLCHQFVAEFADYYGAALFTRAPVDIVTSEQVLAGKAGDYKLLVVPHAWRARQGVLEKLAAYAQAGGTVLVSPDSLRFDDDSGARLETEAFLGGRAGKPLTQAARPVFQDALAGLGECGSKGIASAPSGERDFDFAAPVHGYEFEPTTARLLAAAGGKPALTVNDLGRGKVYHLAYEPSDRSRFQLMRWIAGQCGARADLETTSPSELPLPGDLFPFLPIETHRFERDGRQVWYALNFGGACAGRLVPAEAAKPMTVRNVRDGKYLKPDGGTSATPSPWTPDALKAGVPVEFPSQDPVVLLLEDPEREPLALETLSDEQREALAWLYRKSPASEKKILIDAVSTLEGRMHAYRMPTAVKRLEDLGYEVHTSVKPLAKLVARNGEDLKDATLGEYRVLILAGLDASDLDEPAQAAVLAFVKGGGGLLYCAPTEYHHAGKAHPLARALGLEIGRANFHDPERNALGEPLYARFEKAGEHPITQGVSEWQPPGAKPVRIVDKDARATALFAGGPVSYTFHPWGEERRGPGQPALVAVEYGQGRAAVAGADSWLRPDDLARGENLKLFERLIRWLGKE